MAKAIMVQGTMSNAGKSLIAAGLCRIFKQDGYKVAPFKSQNMALNSYITEDGLELGRAQVVQAEACGIKPTVHMNPILLKPTTDMGSQVILQGQVVGNMKAMDYYKQKLSFVPKIMESYETLAKENDIIVIEGAGSPAELNLKQDDIVNMGMAKLADAPVLLVGDIDRGGVFAQLIGTVLLLDSDEQDRIIGLVVNKFRGDRKILEPGIKILEERSSKPVLGVVPYMDVDIEDEDSLTERFNRGTDSVETKIDVAVIKLPKISNFTDFQALGLDAHINLRYVTKEQELGTPQVVILPGTKNTISDMKWLKESGFAARIMRLYKQGTMVVGICGGYQMLGEKILDENGVEGEQQEIKGLGLIPVVTTFQDEKRRTQIKGKVSIDKTSTFSCLQDSLISGYEIHMGETKEITTECNICSEDNKIMVQEELTRETAQDRNENDLQMQVLQVNLDDGSSVTLGHTSENVFGTYLHGLFDEEDFCQRFVEMLCEKYDVPYEQKNTISYQEYKEMQYDRLADILRESLDMPVIYEKMGLK